jgi:hypothetical protein
MVGNGINGKGGGEELGIALSLFVKAVVWCLESTLAL